MIFYQILAGLIHWTNLFFQQLLEGHVSLPDLVVQGTCIPRRTHAEGIKILGSWVTLDGGFVVELSNRIHKAWGTFWKFRPALCALTQNIGVRLRLLDRSVKPTLFYASGSWNLTISQIKQLSKLQYASNSRGNFGNTWNLLWLEPMVSLSGFCKIIISSVGICLIGDCNLSGLVL